MMEIAKITSKGQITIPVEIRKKLNLKDGDKVVFIEDGDRIILANAAAVIISANTKQTGFKFSWKGGLADIRDKYSSVELQHKSQEKNLFDL